MFEINELLIWMIQFSPFISCILIMCFFYKNNLISSSIAIIGGFLSWILSLLLLVASISKTGESFILSNHLWFSVFNLDLNFGVMSDGLTAIMIFVVTSVALLVQIFSKGYLNDDPSISRYYVFLSLFIFSMLGAVLASNLLQIFIFWELMGLCSFLLIGFWFEKPQAVIAARKAFLITRLGDLGFIFAIVLIWNQIGTLDILLINESASKFESFSLLLITIGLLCGAMGKSAQFPLHVWLPDAMEGPTPVSALIHAATMVAAGVFLIARFFPLFELVHEIQVVMLTIGLVTLLLTGLLGIASNDIKRVLAYSTISQLGYMFVALGLGAYVAAIFHLITHAFFKALLFLGSGSINHSTGTFDMRHMGGLRKTMPLTYITFLIGALSLCGIFPFAGFWSKEVIVGIAYEKNIIVFVALLAGIFMTSLYVFRTLILTFFGEFKPSKFFIEQKKHLHESSNIMVIPLIILAVPAFLVGFIDFYDGFEQMLIHANPYLLHQHVEHHFHWFIPIISTGLILGGALVAYQLFYKNSFSSARQYINNSFLIKILNERYYIDYLYEQFFVSKVLISYIGAKLVFFDKEIIDNFVNSVGKSSMNVGQIFIKSVNGQMQFYSLIMISGLILSQIFLLIVSFYVAGS
jgi:NADH-quinone oxidoreductase subunit L